MYDIMYWMRILVDFLSYYYYSDTKRRRVKMANQEIGLNRNEKIKLG